MAEFYSLVKNAWPDTQGQTTKERVIIDNDTVLLYDTERECFTEQHSLTNRQKTRLRQKSRKLIGS